MKKIILGLLVLTSISAFAGVTPEQKKEACKLIQNIVPTENGKGISVKECLKSFSFEKTFETPALVSITMMGQTVEDMTTVCTVNLKVNIGFGVSPAAPTCELQ